MMKDVILKETHPLLHWRPKRAMGFALLQLETLFCRMLKRGMREEHLSIISNTTFSY